MTRTNRSIEIPVYQNDTVSGVVKSVEIQSNPRFGEAAIRSSGNEYYIIYVPNLDYCSSSVTDALIYEVCNQIGCDRTMVHIGTLCDGFIIRNGFSPNGDGKNDFFVIENLADYPNTHVSIFNRWGTRVYESKDYKNDWKGDFDGAQLPDGTYFYRIVLENGESHTGYLQILR